MKKWISIFLALLLLFSLTACGDTPTDRVDSSSSAVSEGAVSLDTSDTTQNPSATTQPSSSSTASVVSVTQTTTTTSTTKQPSVTSTTVTTKTGTTTKVPHNTVTTSTKQTVSSTTTTKKPTQTVWYSKENATITKATVDAVMRQNYTKPRNVIVMIGDGMGPNDIALTEKYSKDCWDFGLIMNRFINHGMAITASADNAVTDSAASATALATGYKTNNNIVGMLPDKTPLKNISEIAREQGKKVGIVTNDEVTGATPSGFTVHAINRVATKLLANGYVDFMPDVLMGQGQSKFEKALTTENKKKLQETALTAATFNAATAVLNQDKACNKPFFGFFLSDLFGASNYYLAYATDIALHRLDNKNGFFLMVESAGTDKAGHENRIDAKMNNVITFERALAVVLNYMKDHPDTLLLVTSDHETGGVQLPAAGEQPSNSLFTGKDHTSTNVRVFALGAGAAYFKGKTVDNTDIAKFAIAAVQGK